MKYSSYVARCVALAGFLIACASASAQPVKTAAAAQKPDRTASMQWLKDRNSDCRIASIPAIEADAVSWTGSCTGGHASGPGTLAIFLKGKSVETITGEFSDGALRDGHVSIKWPDGAAYDGNAVAGRMRGVGALTTAGGDRFEGQFVDGRLNGKGTAEWANGDRYDGEWHDGKASGTGIQVWADGRKYDGAWRNDQPNGHGIVTRKDGSHFEGDFIDGEPREAAAQTPASVPPEHAVADAPAKTDAKSDDASSAPMTDVAATAKETSDAPAAVAAIAGRKFVALDGSSLALTAGDDAFTRIITAPNGSAKKQVFAFMSDTVGSVSDGDSSDDVVGVFRVNDKSIVTEYGDGRSETLFANSGNGVSMILHTPNGQSLCMAWYPEGHQYSLAERKAALSAYANRLGIAEDKRKPLKAAKPAPVSDCGTPATANATPVQPSVHRASALTRSLSKGRARRRAQAMPASFIAPLPGDSDHPIEVRTSTVHPIDADVPSAPTTDPSEAPINGAKEVASLETPQKNASASDCLSVESDGAHWTFRNHCAFDVQFAYCLMNAADPLAACAKGAITGSVSPKGASALIADKSLSETNADHDFRWVACSGGAGEVVVHLDKSDPPSGRCVRRGAS